MSHSKLLAQNKCLVLDGASGTALEANGVKMHPVLWSAIALLPEHQQAVEALYKAYFDAGANIVGTPTYQASASTFASICDAQQAEKYMQQSVEHAIQYTQNQISTPQLKLVSGSLGPYGASLLGGEEFSGNYGDVAFETLYDFHLPRIKAVLAGKPDVLLLETIPHQLEVKALMKVIEDVKPEVPIWLAFSAKHGKAELADGTPFSELELRPEIEAVGVNCLPPKYVSICLEGMKHFNIPKIVYPNSNEVYDAVNKVWLPGESDNEDCCLHSASEDQSLNLLGGWDLDDWYAKGARIFGGCCRISPAEIIQVAKKVESFNA